MSYRALWRDEWFPAFPASDSIRLYSSVALDGFSFVREGRYRLVVPASSIARLEYVRVVAVWRGEPFLVRSRSAGWAELEYLGGNAAVALRLGCAPVERGVYRVRVRFAELSDVRDDVVVLSVGAPDRSSDAPPE